MPGAGDGNKLNQADAAPRCAVAHRNPIKQADVIS